MAKRKYITEFGLNMFCDNNIILQQDSLSDLIDYYNEDIPDFHIYMICKRPRIIIKPQNVIITNDFIKLVISIQKGDDFIDFDYKLDNNIEGQKASYFSSEFPFAIISFLDDKKKTIFKSKTSLFVAAFADEIIEFLNLEILYIGQAFGNNGERTAIDRLSSHSTLQKIYSEALNNFPDNEIWLMLCSFSPVNITSIDGRSQNFEMSDKEDDEHVKNYFATPISLQQKINFTEAALIRYFQPQFNEKFKNKFPSKKHKSYLECYNIDLNSVFVELGSDNLFCMLYSKSVSPKWTHYIKYFLHSEKERKNMLDLAL